MPTIYCVEDDNGIRELISCALRSGGYGVKAFPMAKPFYEELETSQPSLILLDIMLPNEDGLSVLSKLKADPKYKDIPVIMLSARGEEYDKLFGFEIGVDDYVVKPFSPKELMARIRAVMNRVNSAKKTEDVITYQGLVINFTAREVLIDGVKAQMTPKEYDLLFYMVRNRGIALTREKLISDVWGYDFFGDDRTLDTHIKLLRKSLGDYADKITTLRGVGYRFEKN